MFSFLFLIFSFTKKLNGMKANTSTAKDSMTIFWKQIRNE